MDTEIVLFGAGSAGRYALRHLRERGITPVRFADNDPAKWDHLIEGIHITTPSRARHEHPDAVWVACGISRPAALELRAQIRDLGVKSIPLWECIPVPHGVPLPNERCAMFDLIEEPYSQTLLIDQVSFRQHPDYDKQIDPLPAEETYFPNWIEHRDDEHFVDAGAADGDTIRAFLDRWPRYRFITAFEPDPQNYEKLRANYHGVGMLFNSAVSDVEGKRCFVPNGDYSSHLSNDGNVAVQCVRLDDVPFETPPTYIKMDIEGAELEALWGGRTMIARHAPALAICAYHTSDHLWQIPLLIHAIQPEYKLYFRRYAEGAFELVYYAVPPDRVKK